MSTDPLPVVMSLSPRLRRGLGMDETSGHQYQKQCVQAWLDVGAQPISVNTADEISLLQDKYDSVIFVESSNLKSNQNPRGLPSIVELIEAGLANCKNDVFAIANSDVLYRGGNSALCAIFEAARGGVVFSHRFETPPLNNRVGLPYLYGFDVMFVDSKFVLPAEMDGFFVGSPWWDYLFMYMLAARDVPLSNIISPLMSHSTHEQAWSEVAWLRGLNSVALRLRKMAVDEGPVAAVLGYICRSLEADAQPAFSVGEIRNGLGIALGAAMVSYVNERCQYVLWLDEGDEAAAAYGTQAILRRTAFEHANLLL